MEGIIRSTKLLQYLPFDDLLQLCQVNRQCRSFTFYEISHRIKKFQKNGMKSTFGTTDWVFYRAVLYLYEDYDDFVDKDFQLLILGLDNHFD